MLNSIKEEECGITFADTDAQLSLFENTLASGGLRGSHHWTSSYGVNLSTFAHQIDASIVDVSKHNYLLSPLKSRV